MARFSGLQKDVIKLYRQCIRQVHHKPAENQHKFRSLVRQQFRSNSHIAKRDFATVEFLLRKGRRTLETYSNPSVRNISVI